MSQLPSNWTIVPLKHVAHYSAGRTPARAEPRYWANDSRSGFPWVSIGDMAEYGTITCTKEQVSEQAHDEVFRRRIVSAGTLLMSFKLTIGRVATLGIDAYHNEAIISIRPKAGVNQEYLKFFLAQVDYAQYQDRQVKGQTLNQEKLDRVEINLPQLDEQTRIATLLNLVRRSIDQATDKLTVTDELKRTMMHRLFTRGLRGEAQKETEIGPVPESWEVVQLGDCGVVQSGVTKGRKLDGDDVISVSYLRVANVQDGFLDLREVKSIQIKRSELSRFLLRHGDVLMTEGGDLDKLGRGHIWQGEIENCVHQNHIFAVRMNRERLVPKYFAYLLQSTHSKNYFLAVGHKTTNLATINSTKLKAFPVLVPSLEEQREIIAILEAIDRKIDLHQRKHAVLEELFRTLLHKLMTGEIRVADLDLSTLETPSKPTAALEATA